MRYPCNNAAGNIEDSDGKHAFSGYNKTGHVKDEHEDSTCFFVTSAFNLPSRFVIHTVGPVVEGKLNERHKEQLRSCLDYSEENDFSGIAFC